MRFYELANQIGIDKKNVNLFLDFAKASGFEIKNSLAVIDDHVAKWASANQKQIAAHISDNAAEKAEPVNKKRLPIGKKKVGTEKVTDKKSPPTKSKTIVKAEKSTKSPTDKVGDKITDKAKTDKHKPATKTAGVVPSKDKKRLPPPPPKKKEHRVVVPLRTPAPMPKASTLVVEDAQTARADTENKAEISSHKHKRADFKMLSRPDLPAIFATADAEYTRSIRSAGSKRPSASSRNQQMRQRQRQRGGNRGATVEIIRDPNAKAQLTSVMSVRELSEAIGKKLNEIIGFMMRSEQMISVNSILDKETITLIAEEFKVPYEWRAAETLEQQIERELHHEEKTSAAATRFSRAPIITFMGHVDHGKTSLLDKIRSTRVVDKEHGGITQHIGAYTVQQNGRKITFLDTPGHEAFTQMRARGANLTDVVVLVVAADDGVMPQTKEACNHAKNAGVPIVVAINKCDIAGANPDRVRQEISTQLELLPEEWGGTIGAIDVSAITGDGIDNLLERILLEAEVLELDADPARNAVGFIIESKMSESRGAVATVLIKDGTLKRGDVILTGNGYGKVRLMYNWNGETCDEGGPSDAVSVIGLNNVPEVGEKVYVVEDMVKARKLSEERESKARAQVLANNRRVHVSLENLMEHLQAGDKRELNLIIKADVSGSLEVLQKTVTDLSTDEVSIRVIHSGVGAISQADVILADASDALIVGFHVIADSAAKLQAASLSVQIKIYHIIYRLIEDMRAALEGLLPKEEREIVRGHIDVREIFRASKYGNIAGCYVTDGYVNRKCRVRLIRDGAIIYENTLESLKRFKDDAKEVRAGFECGLRINGYDDIRQGDTVEAFEIEEIARKL